MGNDRSRCDWDRPNGTNKDNSQPDRNHRGNSIDKTRSVGRVSLTVIVKELGQVTIEDTFAIETGYGDRNEWLEWVKYTTRTTQAQGCYFCAAARPNLAHNASNGKKSNMPCKII